MPDVTGKSTAPILFPPLFLLGLTAVMWAFDKWPNKSLVIGGSIILGLWGALQLVGMIQLGMTGMVFGPEFQDNMKRLRKYRLLSTSPILVINRWYGYCGILIFVQSLFMQIKWIGIAIALLGTAAFNFARFIQPPFALVLGISGNSGKDIAKITTLACVPYQVTNLLEMGRNRGIFDAYTKATTLRIGTEVVSWQLAVAEIAEIAKIVVFDVRALSESVEEELKILSSLDVWFKTILVAEDNKPELPLTIEQDVILKLTLESKIVRVENLSKLINSLKKSPDMFPTKEKPIAMLVLEGGDT